MADEDIELAEEHVRLAEDIVLEKSRKSKNPKKEKEFKEAEFALERAESEIHDLEEE